MPPLTIRRRSALPLLTGLAVAQVIATIFVHRSNLDLLHNVGAMQAAGWLALPAGPAAQGLSGPAAAFGGGLFYTLSIGVGLALATWAALCGWQRLSAGRPKWLLAAAPVWAALLIGVNWRGWVLFPSLFVVFVPLATLLTAIRTGGSGSQAGRSARLWALPLITLALLAGIWTTQLNERLFTNLRDYLLLSNPAGRTINDYYYRYTLYAAHPFKSFGQKTLRTCRLEPAGQGASMQRWVAVLAGLDVVATPGNPHADVVVRIGDRHIELSAPTGERIDVERNTFLSKPESGLRRFSEATDRYAPFRRITFAGLLLGFPIMLFVVLDGAVARLADRYTGESTRMWWRSGVCLAVGLALLIPMAGRPAEITAGGLGRALAADRWPVRVAALRLIEREKLDLAAFPQYRGLLESPLIVERYYVARALAFSRTPATLTDLLALMHDPHPNVVCQAYYALGRRGNPVAVAPVKARMTNSDHWYTQWYGYRALRSLGWRQRR